ncbi:hypothetical protein [Sporosarcina psychrophila]|uniref:hypothetical protein n=1 Tax=Sporosarcina psychrophila TaxID=1476 RepID=UPI0018D41EC1|nr:hypothetical protein [Sporosarcina psychrophila]
MLFTGLKTLVAFYISGLAFQVFIGDQPLNMDTIMPIILLQVIPGWSEFLVSFALIIFIGLVLFHVIIWISGRPIIFWSITSLLYVTTWIDYGQFDSTYIGLLVGTTKFPTFPVLQYIPFYLIGIYFAKYRIEFQWKYLIISILGTTPLYFYLMTNNFQLPERFPPSMYWIIGPVFFLYLYYVLSKFLEKRVKGPGILQIMGENVLFYLIISNVFIFSLDSKLHLFIIGPWKGLFFTISLLMVITYLINITSAKPKK